MKNTEEEGLDNIFKKGLNQPGHAADYRESDWDAFEQMLDQNQKKPFVFWMRIAGGIAALLLLTFGWFYMQTNNKQPVKQQLAIHRIKNTDSGSKQALTQVSPAAANKDNTGTSGGYEHKIADGSNKNPSSVNRTHILAIDRYYQKDKSFFPLSGPAARRDTTGLINTDDNKNRALAEVLAAVSEQNIQTQKMDDAVTFPVIKDEPVVNPVKATLFNPNRRAQLAITVLASPDINGAGSFSQAQVGTNIGVLFSVGVSKFTFSTGAAYSKKPYTTAFGNYHTNYPFKVDPLNVSADCRVLDIPLNVDYRVYSKSKNQFSVGSGLSSYLMLSEDYRYNYAAYTYGPAGYNVVNQNQHFLGVLNLDATYQRKLNSKISLDVQPYLKIPLTNIGASQVKLQSAGIAFGLRWNLNSLSKP